MNGLKPVIFMATFGVFYGMTSGLQAANPLQPELSAEEPALIQLADSEGDMNSRGILNGQKGYRHHRPGYRQHSDGWWYPLKAFEKKKSSLPDSETADRKKTQASLPAAHIQWCQQTYRSYRQEDNTFQPYEGPRKPCRSAFLKKK